MRRFFFPGLIGLALLAALVWAFAPRPQEVEVAKVARRALAVTLEEEGEARIREVFTVSAPLTGKLERIALHPGDTVRADETVVARIGPTAPALLDARARAVAEAALAAAEAAVDLARAQQMQAEAERDFAVTEAARAQKLAARGAASQQALDSAELARNSAEAAVRSAAASLAVRERERDSAAAVLAMDAGGGPPGCCRAVITPVSGQVLRVLSESEQVVAAGTPLLEIGDPADLEITARLLSRDAVGLAPGAAAEIVGWGGPALAARVERIDPAAETRVSALGIEEQRVEVVLTLTGPEAERRALGHGFRVIVRVTLWQAPDVLTVPVAALFRDGADWAVFAVTGARAVLRPITLGPRNAEFAQVLAGLAEGDQVVVHPADTLAEQSRVRAIPVQ